MLILFDIVHDHLMNLSKFNSYYKSNCVVHVKQLVKNVKFNVPVQDLETRANIDKEEKEHVHKKIDEEERESRCKNLMEEVVAGVVRARVLALARYEAYEHFYRDSAWNQSIDDGPH